MTTELTEEVAEAIASRFGEAIHADETILSGLRQLEINADALVDVLRVAKEEHGFRQLYDLTAADYLEQEPYIHVIYHLNSLTPPAKLMLKVRVHRESGTLPSVTDLWPMANWFEREVYDLYGIVFEGHPDLKRILMPDDWMGHPLRRDYPLTEEPIQFRNYTSEMLPSEVIPKQYED